MIFPQLERAEVKFLVFVGGGRGAVLTSANTASGNCSQTAISSGTIVSQPNRNM